MLGPIARISLAALAALALIRPAAGAEALARQQTESSAAFTQSVLNERGPSVPGTTARPSLPMGPPAAGTDPVAAKLSLWLRLTAPDGEAPFETIAAFITANPDWPGQRTLRRRAEEAMPAGLSTKRVLAWFERYPPLTANGYYHYGRALRAAGQGGKAARVVRDGWINRSIGKDIEREYLKSFGALLTPADHRRRLDQLLWKGWTDQARRMLPRVGAGYRALAVARMRLRAMKPGVDRALAKVPKHLRADPGLIYERVRWRRRKERDDGARALLHRHHRNQPHAELWWTERRILARRALDAGYISEAYRLTREHAVKDGRAFAEAEWLAGWIALRFLREPKVAGRHFQRMYDAVRFPISRARGAYWLGRAAEAAGGREQARIWYQAAALYPNTFYGQLAMVWLHPGNKLSLPPDPKPSAAEVTAFKGHELVRAVRLLAATGQQQRLPPFISKLAALGSSPGWQVLTAALAREAGRRDLGVWVAKRATHKGISMIDEGYPAVRLPAVAGGPPSVEEPLVLAIIRQESAYRADAISRAGARGLMQLMPGTARGLAKKVGLPYSKRRLIGDPDYNLALGQAYLRSMLDRFEGSYVMALAAYNAGPYRVERWRRANGDPGASIEEAIDWVELIPFNETRNYVQRTLEHLQVYRSKLAGTAYTLNLERDLRR